MSPLDAALALERFSDTVRELQTALDCRPWTPLEQLRHRGELLATDEGREGP